MITFGDIRSAVAAQNTDALLRALQEYRGNPEEALLYVRDSWGYIPAAYWEISMTHPRNTVITTSLFSALGQARFKHLVAPLKHISAGLNVGDHSVKIGDGSRKHLSMHKILYPFRREVFDQYWLPHTSHPDYAHINKRLEAFFWNLKLWGEGHLTFRIMEREQFYILSELAIPYSETPLGLTARSLLTLDFHEAFASVVSAHKNPRQSPLEIRHNLEARYTVALLKDPDFQTKYWSFY